MRDHGPPLYTDEAIRVRAEVRAIPGLPWDAPARLWDAHRGAYDRYRSYRRRGLGPAAAYEGAMAWARNMNEQAARRCSHDTGAEREWMVWR